ncbi:MAG: hypothetical protein ACR2NU_10665 [Aeoliella sp.]
MPDLSPELLLAALVVTSLATGGLLGLWAASSRWHWFARTMVVFAVLTPLLWRPIYEPFVTLLVEVAVVVLGVMIYRRNWPKWRFSVRTLLMLTVPVAILTAAAMRAPEIEWIDGGRTVGLGVVGGAIAMLATWLSRSQWKWWKRAVVIVVALPLLAIGWAATDYIALFADEFIFFVSNSTTLELWLIDALWATLSVAMLLLAVFLLLPTILEPAEDKNFRQWLRRLAIGLAVVIFVFPSYVAWLLSNPLPIPEITHTASPAYLELVELAETTAFAKATALGAAATIDWNAMRKAVLAADKEYERALALVDEPQTMPFAYDLEMPYFGEIGQRRTLARVWSYKAKVARDANDSAAALEACEWPLRYTQELRGQGLLIDALVTTAMEGIGLSDTYHSAHLFDTQQLKRLALQLAIRSRDRPSLEPLWRRERIFSENCAGWQGHVIYLFNCWLGTELSFSRKEMTWSVQRRGATLGNLLAAKLALDAHKLETDNFPAVLSDLVPEYLSHVPDDPCSEDGDSLVYRRIDEGYVLYSRGFDGDDDGARPCEHYNEFEAIDWKSDGDLTLDEFFKEENW